MPLISLKKLHLDRRNANHCDEATIQKLTKHMEKSQFCPALLVRPHPLKKNEFIIIDGHHRLLVAQTLGWKSIECQVVSANEEEAGLLLLTINRLRGTDIPRKRAELMQSLLPTFPINELAQLLPESSEEISGLLALLKQEEEALQEALNAQIEEELRTLPVPFGFMVPAHQAQLVKDTLAEYQKRYKTNADNAFITIFQKIAEMEKHVHA